MGLFHFTAAHRGLKRAAEAVVRAAGATCPDQADEQEPGSLTAREWDIYMYKTLTRQHRDSSGCHCSVFNLIAQRAQFAGDLEGTSIKQVSS